MNEVIIQGIVLKTVDYGENDSIVSVLTKEGIYVFKARGIKKLTSKNRSSCLLYSESEFILNQSKQNYYSLVKGKLINGHFNIYSNYDLLLMLNLVSESILTFLENNINIEIFLSFKEMLKGIDNHFDIYTLASINLAKIVNQTGYGLEISRCVNCSNTHNIVKMDYDKGGFICLSCYDKNNVDSVEYLNTILYIFKVKIDDYFKVILNKDVVIKIIKDLLIYLKKSFGFTHLKYQDNFLNEN